MVDKVLKIDTVLGKATQLNVHDELLLIFIDGREYVSQPFRYEMLLLRGLDAHNDDKPEIDPRHLLGTSATVGILLQGDEYVQRTGVFAEFHRTGRAPDTHGKHGYFAAIVPAFQFLGRETRYRIFEDKTVVDVLKTCLTEMHERFPDFKFDISSIEKLSFPKEFYVQFGESTFGFLSRMMARHGLFYYFGQTPGQEGDIINDTLVIGRDRPKQPGVSPPTPFANISMELSELDDGHSQIGSDSTLITGVRRAYMPSLRNASVLDFNILDPTVPVRGKDQIVPGYDVVGGGNTEGPGSFLRNIDSMAAIALKTSGASDPSPADDYAEVLLARDEPGALRLTGNTSNAAFAAGSMFHVAIDNTMKGITPPSKIDGLDTKDFLITTVNITGTENSYKGTTAEDVGDFFSNLFKPLVSLGKSIGGFGKRVIDGENLGKLLGDTWSDITDAFKGNANSPDPIITLAAQGLNNYLQNEASDRVTDALYPHHPDNWTQYTPFVGYFFGGIIANATGVLPSLFNPMSAIGSALLGNDGKMSAAFSAIPYRQGEGFALRPPVVGEKPRAHGPHFATVVGMHGVQPNDAKTNTSVDIFADVLGRVRIRFPWDPGPPGADGKPTDPLQSQMNTCWVRVVEGWAGDGFGTQFLPRIGQEVIVDFIDGDPERPVIVGRMYNARNPDSATNLPFPMPGFAKQKITNDYLLEPAGPTPNDTMRRSGIRTRSMPSRDPNGAPKTPDRFHLLRFDDTRDKEQYLVRSQGRLDITAYNHRYENISRDRNLTVGGKKITPPPKEIGGDYITKIYRHYYLHVGDPEFPTQSGNRVTRLEQSDELFVKKDTKLDSGTYSAVTGNYYLHVSGRPDSGGGKRDTIVDQDDRLLVKGDVDQMISGNWSTALAKQMSVRSDTKIVLEAFSNISLVVGGSSIVMTPSSIAITSPMVLINSGGPPPADPIVPPSPPVNDPVIPQPKEPTQADPGVSLDPPTWQT